jgi:hypothetical protein
MKKFKLCTITLAAVSLSFSVRASTNIAFFQTNYSSGTGITQFNTNAGYYDRGDSLDGTPVGAGPANQWQTTDSYDSTNDVGGTSQLQFIPGYTGGEGPSGADAGNNSVYWGGYDSKFVLPGITNPSLFYNFTQQYSTATLDPAAHLVNVTFTSDFTLFPSTGANPNDTFGYSFWTLGGPGMGSLLAQVQFTNINATDFGVSLNGVDAGTLTYNAIYSLQAVFDANDSLALSFAGVTAQTNGAGVVTNYSRGGYTFVGATNLAFGSTDAFESASIDWVLASGNPSVIGDNYMVINSLEIASAVTPEPGTILAGVLLLGATVYTSVRRRRQAKAEGVA